jgi:hypothetical protein
MIVHKKSTEQYSGILLHKRSGLWATQPFEDAGRTPAAHFFAHREKAQRAREEIHGD